MRDASPALIALLNDPDRDSFLIADLYDITLRSGRVIHWTTYDQDLTLDGIDYRTAAWPCDAPLTRNRTRMVRGLEVDTLEITIGGAEAVNIGGVPMPLAAINGALDGARVRLSQVYMPSPGDTSPGALIKFNGEVQGIDPSSTEVTLHVQSMVARLNQMVPLNLYMPACAHAVYDPGCGLIRGDFTVTGQVAASPVPTTTVFGSNLTDADGYFDLGVLSFASGPNAGVRRAVRSYANSGGTFTLALPLPAAPDSGTVFEVYPGCARTVDACRDKFDNLVHFRGFPHAPPPETIR